MGDGEPRLLDQVRDRIRRKHYSIRTEQAYVDWIRRFVLHHNKTPPRHGGSGGRACGSWSVCACGWRVKDIDFAGGEIVVRQGREGPHDRAAAN